MYARALKWWIENSSFDLLVLDSSGRGVPRVAELQVPRLAQFNVPRLHVFSFDQRCCKPPPGPKPTNWELLALSTLCRERASLLLRYDLVVKVTGKYRVPGLPAALEAAGRSRARYVIQASPRTIRSNHCELFGARGKLFGPLIAEFLEHTGSLEKRLYVVVNGQPETAVHRLPLLPIPKEFRVVRNNGSVMRDF
mgnify:CR=1 FL=1